MEKGKTLLIAALAMIIIFVGGIMADSEDYAKINQKFESKTDPIGSSPKSSCVLLTPRQEHTTVVSLVFTFSSGGSYDRLFQRVKQETL